MIALSSNAFYIFLSRLIRMDNLYRMVGVGFHFTIYNFIYIVLTMGNKNSGNYRESKLTKEQRKKIILLANAGFSKTELAKLYKVSRTYIYQLLKPRKKKT